MKHTPTPWIYLKDVNSPLYVIENGEIIVGRVDTKANAEFIVRAVNNHEALLKAAKLMLKLLESDGSTHYQWRNIIKEAEAKDGN